MISKKIIKDEESLKKIQAGVNKLNDAVKNSLGPSGLNIILDKDIFYALDKEFTIVEKLLTLDGENEIFTTKEECQEWMRNNK